MADAISVSMLDFAGNMRFTRTIMPKRMAREEVISAVSSIITDTLQDTGIERYRLFGLGVGISGFFVSDDHRVNAPDLLEDWALIDIESELSQYFGLPVWVENDGNVAAVGESMVGVGRWAPSFAYLYIATGFGGGVIVDGKLFRGRIGNAGEYAGVLPPNGYPHPNLQLLRKLVVEHDKKSFRNVSEMLEEFNVEWKGVGIWLEKVLPSLELVISASAAILDVDAIVLGGRLPRSLAEQIIPKVEIYNTSRRNIPRPVPVIVAAEASGDATALGAAALPLQESFFS
ncbi:MAG: ROK family protein [Xanthomonadales bacterium]|nr:ROK family protein [Xanthomonadales bacterium]